MLKGRSITIFFSIRFSKFLSLKIMKVVTFNRKKDLKEIPSLLFKLYINRLRMQFASPVKAGLMLREQREQLQGL